MRARGGESSPVQEQEIDGEKRSQKQGDLHQGRHADTRELRRFPKVLIVSARQSKPPEDVSAPRGLSQCGVEPVEPSLEPDTREETSREGVVEVSAEVRSRATEAIPRVARESVHAQVLGENGPHDRPGGVHFPTRQEQRGVGTPVRRERVFRRAQVFGIQEIRKRYVRVRDSDPEGELTQYGVRARDPAKTGRSVAVGRGRGSCAHAPRQRVCVLKLDVIPPGVVDDPVGDPPNTASGIPPARSWFDPAPASPP